MKLFKLERVGPMESKNNPWSGIADVRGGNWLMASVVSAEDEVQARYIAHSRGGKERDFYPNAKQEEKEGKKWKEMTKHSTWLNDKYTSCIEITDAWGEGTVLENTK